VGGFIFVDPIPIQHIWSLNVEEHCYVLMALIAAIGALRRSAATVLLALGVCTFGFVALHAHYSHDPLKPYMLNTECAASYLLLSAGYRLVPKPRIPEWMVWSALGVGIACFTRLPIPAKGILLPPFLLAFAVNHLEDAPILRRVLSVRWLCWLGLVSYSVYLWQQPLFRELPNVWGIIVALVLGSMSFYLYENPIRQFLNRNTVKKEKRIAENPADSLSSPRPATNQESTP
jgi:peptidoglycan/LPS O-acetylase OafA/YrhL